MTEWWLNGPAWYYEDQAPPNRSATSTSETPSPSWATGCSGSGPRPLRWRRKSCPIPFRVTSHDYRARRAPDGPLVPRGDRVISGLGRPGFRELRDLQREARAAFFKEQLEAAVGALRLEHTSELLRMRTELMVTYANELATLYERNLDNPLVKTILENAMEVYVEDPRQAISRYYRRTYGY